jgi:hypothetical protein
MSPTISDWATPANPTDIAIIERHRSARETAPAEMVPWRIMLYCQELASRSRAGP